MPKLGQTNLTALVFIGLLILFSILPFWPGTSGDYMLDDTPNLSSLKDMGGVFNLERLRQFVFTGVSSSFGRPVSLFTFALDAQDWPVEPYPFKRTNILFHTINTLLLFGFLFALLSSLSKPRREVLGIAFLASLAWAIHPLHTSTVLYVIQRMTEMSALFILASLWCYVHGRRRLNQNPGAAYLWMSATIVIGGTLAFLSKETGILLPLFILIIEFTLFARLPRPKEWPYWAWPFLGLPVLVVLGYFGRVISNAAEIYSQRDFSLYERLLTESRVLLNYIYNFFIPLQTPTVYNEGFPISRGLFDPLSTLFAVAAIIVLIGLAIAWRARQPVLSFAILWFFGAHLLESTVLQLEIYFEHRNYIALVGPALALGYYAQVLIHRKPVIYLPVSLIVISVLAGLSFKHSSTWGNPPKLAEAWNAEYSSSLRVRTNYMAYQLKAGNLDKALEIAEENHKNFPEHLGSELILIMNRCIHNQLTKDEIIHFLQSAETLPVDDIAVQNLKLLAIIMQNQTCVQIRPQGLMQFVNAMLKNPDPNKKTAHTHFLHVLNSEINYLLRQFEPAYNSLKLAFETRPSITMAIRLANLTASAKRYELAQYHLQTALLLNKKRNPLLPSREPEITLKQQELWREEHNN